MVQKVSEAYKCKPIGGMLSHQLKQFVIDGEKTIIQNPNEAQKKEHEKYELQVHEVYAMDVLISTGEGVVSIILKNFSSFASIDENWSHMLIYRAGKLMQRQVYSRKLMKYIS